MTDVSSVLKKTRKSRAKITFKGMKLRLKVKKIFTFSEFSTSTQPTETEQNTDHGSAGNLGPPKGTPLQSEDFSASRVQATKVRSK